MDERNSSSHRRHHKHSRHGSKNSHRKHRHHHRRKKKHEREHHPKTKDENLMQSVLRLKMIEVDFLKAMMQQMPDKLYELIMNQSDNGESEDSDDDSKSADAAVEEESPDEEDRAVFGEVYKNLGVEAVEGSGNQAESSGDMRVVKNKTMDNEFREDSVELQNVDSSTSVHCNTEGNLKFNEPFVDLTSDGENEFVTSSNLLGPFGEKSIVIDLTQHEDTSSSSSSTPNSCTSPEPQENKEETVDLNTTSKTVTVMSSGSKVTYVNLKPSKPEPSGSIKLYSEDKHSEKISLSEPKSLKKHSHSSSPCSQLKSPPSGSRQTLSNSHSQHHKSYRTHRSRSRSYSGARSRHDRSPFKSRISYSPFPDRGHPSTMSHSHSRYSRRRSRSRSRPQRYSRSPHSTYHFWRKRSRSPRRRRSSHSSRAYHSRTPQNEEEMEEEERTYGTPYDSSTWKTANQVVMECLNELRPLEEEFPVSSGVQHKRGMKPGNFTGKQRIKPLTKDRHRAGRQAWAKKDMLRHLAPVRSEFGIKMLKRMGWEEGKPLGKMGEGQVEPITMDVKLNRSGLTTKMDKRKPAVVPAADKQSSSKTKHPVEGKNPVSALQEICAQKHWSSPKYELVTSGGPSHKKTFLFQVTIPMGTFQPVTGSNNKKQAKAKAATAALQGLNMMQNSVEFSVSYC